MNNERPEIYISGKSSNYQEAAVSLKSIVEQDIVNKVSCFLLYKTWKLETKLYY